MGSGGDRRWKGVVEGGRGEGDSVCGGGVGGGGEGGSVSLVDSRV